MKRRLIVCADGTWNTAEVASPTSVVSMDARMIQNDLRRSVERCSDR